MQQLSYESEGAKPLKSWLLLAALGLLFADIIAIILLQWGSGLAQRMRRVPAAAAIVAALVFALSALPTSTPVNAQEIFGNDNSVEVVPPKTPVSPTDQRAMDSTSKVTLGYVLTGNTEIDEVSRQGLDGLGRLLAVRTAVEPGQPVGVNILTDDLVFYPVLYWPVLPDAEPLPEPTLAKIDAYMKQGGLIVFDTQDYGRGLPTGAPLGQGESRAAAHPRAPRRAAAGAGAGEPRAHESLLPVCATSPAAGTADNSGSRRRRTTPARITCAARASPTASPRSS